MSTNDSRDLTQSENEHINQTEGKLRQTICDEFIAVCNKYFKRGYYVVTANEHEIPESIEFTEDTLEIMDGFGMKVFNVKSHKCAYKYNMSQFASGELIKPTEPYEDTIFENIFRFGCGCKGFTTDRTVYKFPQYPKWESKKLYEILSSAPIDQYMLKFLLWISIHGGYINDSKGLSELNITLSSLIGCDILPDPCAFVLPYRKN